MYVVQLLILCRLWKKIKILCNYCVVVIYGFDGFLIYKLEICIFVYEV